MSPVLDSDANESPQQMTKSFNLGDELSPSKSDAPEHEISMDKSALKAHVKGLETRIQEQENEGEELLEFNKELQWTLMMMKKDNDTLRENLEYLMNGGDPKKLEDENLTKLIGTSPEKFKTPHVDNVFEMHSEF